MSLLPRTTLHSDSEQLLCRKITYFEKEVAFDAHYLLQTIYLDVFSSTVSPFFLIYFYSLVQVYNSIFFVRIYL
jgi:hypothetical protein